MAQNMKTEYIGNITADGSWCEIFRANGRRHRLMHLLASNKTAVTVSLRARESADGTTWTSIYGATLAPVAAGVDIGSVTWQQDQVVVEARGLADGQICVEEISAKEAFCSTDGVNTAAGTQSMWYEVERSVWCSSYCQTGSEALPE